MADFLPRLAEADVAQAAQLIQQTYAPEGITPENQQRLQQELFDIQKRHEAWGLVCPFLQHADPNVQFFGAHTAVVKISRDWNAFPEEHRLQLRDLILNLTAHAAVSGLNKVILRKLFVSLTSIALKLAPNHPSQWPDWILACVTHLSGRGANTATILDFLAIVAEETLSADLIGSKKAQMAQTMTDAAPMVVQAVTTSVSQQPRDAKELGSALKCFDAWLSQLPGNDLTKLIPLLIGLLSPDADLEFNDDTFVPASDTLQEIMSKSAFSDGSGTLSLTEPLLVWLEKFGSTIVDATLTSKSTFSSCFEFQLILNPKDGMVDDVSHSLCKLLAALGDHSTSYLAANLASTAIAVGTRHTRGHLVQTFLRLLLSYTSLPGFYGVDEEESEMTLGFWYLFQESLWSSDYQDAGDDWADSTPPPAPTGQEEAQWVVAKAVYGELINVLRRKTVWPTATVIFGWAKDQMDTFHIYRRDIGDTLINAYYVLRNDMLSGYVTDLQQRLSGQFDSWEEIEATLHCVMSVQEAVPVDDNAQLCQVFSSRILGRLPTTGQDRIRRTTLNLIAAYASWFTTQTDPTLLMGAITYVVSGLGEPSVCLPAANALRDLCDANRTALAPHIGAFADLHAGLTGIPDTEKSKVLQSIASVIQALPPEDAIPPVEAILGPVVQGLAQALSGAAQQPVEDAQALVILHLQTLTGVAKGLTRIADSILVIDESPEEKAQAELMRRGRDDHRMVRLRDDILDAIQRVIELWSTDAGIGSTISELFKSITCLPSDVTLISLLPGPLLDLVCQAAQRQLTTVWLSLASMLILQLDSFGFGLTAPSEEALQTVTVVLPLLLQTSLNTLGRPRAMEENPDIVQAFFGCMESLAQRFTSSFFQLPPGGLDTFIQCATGALLLQERYAMCSACNFLTAFIKVMNNKEALSEAKQGFLRAHGPGIMRAILFGFAAVAPRSTTPNLIELLSILVSSAPNGCRTWIGESLFAEDFVESKATREDKEKFMKAIVSARSMKRTREAAQQFTLVARGLDGSSFGYASVSM